MGIKIICIFLLLLCSCAQVEIEVEFTEEEVRDVEEMRNDSDAINDGIF